MNNKNRTANPPRGLSGPIYAGMSNAYFGWCKPSTVKAASAAPELTPVPASLTSAGIDSIKAEDSKPPTSGMDQAVCPALPEANMTGEIAPVESEPPTDKPRRQCGTAANLIELVPPEGTIPKKQLIVEWRVRYGNHQRGRALLEALIADRKLFEWHTKRAGTNPAKSISRHPQPLKPE